MKKINLGLMKGNLFVQYIGYERIIVSNTYIMLNADRTKTTFDRNDAHGYVKDMNKIMMDLDVKRNFIINVSDFLKENKGYLETITDCETCKGSGYIKDCTCGHDVVNDLALEAFYDIGIEYCEICDNSGWAPALEDDENAKQCTCCGTTGKVIKDFDTIFKVGESYINKENLKTLIDCLGTDITLSSDGNPLSPICIQFDGGYGYMGSINPMDVVA
ncbi:MAG: hypothetical protein ACRC4Y_00305 [Cetobacterium sp.]